MGAVAFAFAIAVAPSALADDYVDTEGRMLCGWVDSAKMVQQLDPSSPYAATPQQVMNNMMTYVMNGGEYGYSSAQARNLISASFSRFCPNNVDYLKYS
ncbi:hypothetical protein [Mycobacterium sp. C31M]